MIDRPNDLGNLIAYYVPPLAEMQMSKKEYHPYANWVRVLRPVERDSVHVQEYRLRPFDLYDGVPPWEFSTDTRWKKLPKDWTYSTDLMASRRTIDEKLKAEWQEFAKNASTKDPESLLLAIEKGFFVPRNCTRCHVEAEIIKNQYRLIYAADRTLNDNDTRIIPRSKLYYTYEEAFVQAEGVITDRLNELESLHRADVVNDICEILAKVPEVHRKEVNFLLRNREYPCGFSLRYFDGKVLLRSRPGKDWEVLWEVPKCFEK